MASPDHHQQSTKGGNQISVLNIGTQKRGGGRGRLAESSAKGNCKLQSALSAWNSRHDPKHPVLASPPTQPLFCQCSGQYVVCFPVVWPEHHLHVHLSWIYTCKSFKQEWILSCWWGYNTKCCGKWIPADISCVFQNKWPLRSQLPLTYSLYFQWPLFGYGIMQIFWRLLDSNIQNGSRTGITVHVRGGKICFEVNILNNLSHLAPRFYQDMAMKAKGKPN